MCLAPPTWNKTGAGKFGPPSIKATLNPGVGLQDMANVLSGKERTNEDPLLKAMRPKIPDPVITPPPQQAKAPNTSPLRRRNAGGAAVPAGSTLLSGLSGIAPGSFNLGSQTLLGGGGG